MRQPTARFAVAVQTLHHDAQRPSHVELTVAPDARRRAP